MITHTLLVIDPDWASTLKKEKGTIISAQPLGSRYRPGISLLQDHNRGKTSRLAQGEYISKTGCARAAVARQIYEPQQKAKCRGFVNQSLSLSYCPTVSGALWNQSTLKYNGLSLIYSTTTATDTITTNNNHCSSGLIHNHFITPLTL